MERETGLEPATTCLEGRNSTTELLPQKHYLKAKSSQPSYSINLSHPAHLEQLSMVEHYSNSPNFDDALDVYHKVNKAIPLLLDGGMT